MAWLRYCCGELADMTVPVNSMPLGFSELSEPGPLTRPPTFFEVLEYSTFWFCICWTVFFLIKSYTHRVFPDFGSWDEETRIKFTKRCISALYGLVCGSSGCYSMYNYFLFGRVHPHYMHDNVFNVALIHFVWYLSIGYLVYDTITLLYYKTYLCSALIIHHVVFVLGTYYCMVSHTWLGYVACVQSYAFTDFMCHLSWIYREVNPKDLSTVKLLNIATAISTGALRLVANIINTLTFLAYGMMNWSVLNPADKWLEICLLTVAANYVVMPPAFKLCHQTFIQKKNWHASHRRSVDDKVM